MYKPTKLLAEKTVELVVALSNGENTQDLINKYIDIETSKGNGKDTQDLSNNSRDTETSKGKRISSLLLEPKSVTKDNIKILIEDGIITEKQLCQGIQGTCP
ncbi:hypothetical protein [Dapis sp. BLCC M229]|uniref:hypothetical protein n=1 Tax=Dapis sp. BLCC M229 TaxID=3400188 RepID=UPI003CF38FDE